MKKGFMTIDRLDFNSIKDSQADEELTVQTSKQLNIGLKVVERVYKTDSWEQYLKDIEEGLGLNEDTEPEEKEETAITPAQQKVAVPQSMYYRGLVAKKLEENSNLKEQRGWLLEQVYFLRKAVNFLEGRKKELEAAVASMEKTIMGGVTALDQLEENDNFSRVSEKVIKKNK